MKKKLLLLSAIATFTFALSGCDSKPTDNFTTELPEAVVSTNVYIETQDVSEQYMEPIRGTVTDNVYANESIKVSFPINEDMYVCSDEEIATIVGFATESSEEMSTLTVEQFEAATAGTVYDMIIFFSDMQSNVNITFMSLDRLGNYATMPVDSYATLTIKQLEAISTVNYTFGEITHETYGGVDYCVFDVYTDLGYNQKILIKKENGLMVCITLTYYPELENEMNAFLDSFIEMN